LPRVQAPRENAASLRVHLTNVTGLGAVHLVESLLPALEALRSATIDEIYLPDEGALSAYQRATPGPAPARYRRRLPNGMSRVLECSVLGHQFSGRVPLLVLGDIPIRCKAPQAVFVQTPLLTRTPGTAGVGGAIKYRIARSLFRRNARFASAFIVQTSAMMAALTETYPEVEGRVQVVAQPVPSWLLEHRGIRQGRTAPHGSPLHLIYPAFDTPHKNHGLFNSVTTEDARTWPVGRLTLTIPSNRNPNPSLTWLECVDVLPPDGVLALYVVADALVYLSLAESYGFPLVEAMWVGIPIVCADRPYARALCGGEAIYFDPENAQSLKEAISELRARLDAGWWPSWADRLKLVPSSWDEVASSIAEIALRRSGSAVIPYTA
jgi:hypothetical protein